MYKSILYSVLLLVCFHCAVHAQWKQTSFGDFGTMPPLPMRMISTQIGLLVLADGINSLYLSKDNGDSWSNISQNLPKTTILDAILIDSLLVVSLYDGFLDSNNDGIFLSTDEGNTWFRASGNGYDLTGVYRLSYFFSRLFGMSMAYNIFVSTDLGNNWETTNTGTKETFDKLFAHNNTLYSAAPYQGHIYMSGDSGKTWIIKSNDISGGKIFSYTVLDDYIFAVDKYAISRLHTDSTKWEYLPISDTLSSSQILVQAVYSFDSTVVFGGLDGTVYQSKDNGNNWVGLKDNLVCGDIFSFVVHNGNLFACTDRGIWSRPLSDLAIKEVYSPSELTIESYPNPFTASTKVSYTLPKRDMVTIEVFDILGRRIQTLANEVMDAGPHSVVFYGENLPYGMYTVKITSGASSEEMKVVLSK